MPLFRKKQTVAFSDILGGLQHAINSAQEVLQAQQVQNIQGFFGGDGKPETHKVQFGDKEMEVPLVALVPRNYLSMDDVEIKFKTKVSAVSSASLPGLMGGHNNQLSAANLHMEMDGISANDSEVMEITIRFKSKETPEGMSRIMDEYNKQI